MIPNPKAIYTLARFAAENIEARPREAQVEIYEALAELLPDKEAKLHAARVAFSIRETATLQLEFAQLLSATTP